VVGVGVTLGIGVHRQHTSCPVSAVVFCTDAIQVPGTWYVIHWPLISPLPAEWENVAGLLSERLLFWWEGIYSKLAANQVVGMSYCSRLRNCILLYACRICCFACT
jgi:hypothetical protein